MNALRPVKLKAPWGAWSKGHVFTDMPANQAAALVARGIAEYETAIVAAPANRMIGGKQAGRRPHGGRGGI
jgi:hypothetical protein